MARKAQKPDCYILTANDLISGDIVYWGQNEAWTKQFSNSLSILTEEDKDKLEQIGKQEENNNIVVGAYIISLQKQADGRLYPLALREQHRIQGPSIEYAPQLQLAG